MPLTARNESDQRWMRYALDLARKGEGLTRPNPPVGAVIVSGGVIAGTGYHRKAGGPHAEIIAIREAGKKARGATLYVSLEPCCTQGRTPPCTDAIMAAGIARVVLSVLDPNPRHHGRGIRLLRRSGIDVVAGICEDEGLSIIAPFAKWISTCRPYITLKLGMSLDGRIADGAGRSRWITSAGSRSDVQHLRKRADAVLIGRGTLLADDPSLLCRSRRRTGAFRIIVDSEAKIPPGARVLNDGYADRTIVATTRASSESAKRMIENKGGRVWILPSAGGMVSLPSLCRKMGDAGLLHVVCEGGGELAGSLIRCGCVDELLLFVAPRVLGGQTSRPAIGGSGWRLTSAPELSFVECRNVGGDLMIRAVPRWLQHRRRSCSPVWSRK